MLNHNLVKLIINEVAFNDWKDKMKPVNQYINSMFHIHKNGRDNGHTLVRNGYKVIYVSYVSENTFYWLSYLRGFYETKFDNFAIFRSVNSNYDRKSGKIRYYVLL